MPVNLFRRALATTLVLALGFAVYAPVFATGPTSLFVGRVLHADGATPRANVTVSLFDRSVDRAFRSGPTNDRGAFRIDGAPAGTYAVVVEAPEGAYLASDSYRLEEGANPPVLLATRLADDEDPPEPDPDAPKEPPTPEPGPSMTPPAPGEMAGLGLWQKLVIVGSLIVGTGFVVDAVSEEDKASKL